MVLELDDPEALYQHKAFDRGLQAPELPPNFGRSRAWIQDPRAVGGAPRWIRAPQFDLPDVPFQRVGEGGSIPFVNDFNDEPFAHSQPMLPPGYRGDLHDSCFDDGDPAFEACAPLGVNMSYGVNLVDLNRDGLSDVIWSRYEIDFNRPPNRTGWPLKAQGVLLNTGTGWCSSSPEMAQHVEGECVEAEVFLPPASSYPDRDPIFPETVSPSGFVLDWFGKAPGRSAGHLADLNADGWLDYIQAHTLAGYRGNKAWLFNPDGIGSQDRGDVWVRDSRYDVDIQYEFVLWRNTESVAFVVLDVNGDGAADVLGDSLSEHTGGSSYVEHPQAFVSKSKHSDLLRLVRNGRGGEIEISYESGVRQRDSSHGGLEFVAQADAIATGEELGSVHADVIRWTTAPVVASIRVGSPNRAPDPADPGSGFGPATTYRYAHPRFCIESRTDLGFRVVEQRRPGDVVIESSYYQVHGRVGQASRILTSENGIARHLYEEDWEVQPVVPSAMPGTITDPEVHVGRVAQKRSMTLYEGGETGAELVRTYEYDDAYGYNFVGRVIETRPTGTTTIVRYPVSDVTHGIHRLVEDEIVYEGVSASTSSPNNFLRHQSNSYWRGRLSSQTDFVKERGTVGGGLPRRRTLDYDTYGNLTKTIVHGSLGDRVTDFCYDGDHVSSQDGSWCPNFGQDSHSVRVGIIDAAGGSEPTYTFRPDPGTGQIIESASRYVDQPSQGVVYDPFGRPSQTFVMEDGVWARATQTVYDDLSTPPVVEQLIYPYAGAPDAEAQWTATVGDGLGGVWKEIEETPSGVRGVVRYSDPTLRQTRTTLPIACADALCSTVDGSTQPFANLVETDGIGRIIREESPLGFGVYEYFPVTKSTGPGPTGVQLDGILFKNGKGDLIQRAVDGDRVAWIDECGNTVPADTTSLAQVACTASGLPSLPRTYITYEATGEVRGIHNPRSTAPYDDPKHYLQYTYDTAGSVVRIEDPALAGPGYSETTYDEYGNAREVTNARMQTRVYSYDVLDRLTGIATPSGETDYSISYRPDELQPGVESSSDYVRTNSYDSLGRLQQEQFAVRNTYGIFVSFYTDYEYDLAGRILEVLHPARHSDGSGGWTDTIVRYEYERGYLRRVCDLGTATSCSGAETQYVEHIEYDEYGRTEQMTFPGGERTFAYDPSTRLLRQDQFQSTAGGSYQYRRDYLEYDGIGNILSVGGSETATPALDMNEIYEYDQRNRIARWTKDGQAHDFGYDDLGNLTLHAGEPQVYDADRPYAIARRDLEVDVQYSYDADGNVASIVGGPTPQYFAYDSANRTVCLGSSAGTCSARVAYDVNGKRVAEYQTGTGAYTVYVGDDFLWEDLQTVHMANVEVRLGDQRVALKRFQASRRGSGAGVFAIALPVEWGVGGGLVVVGVLLLGARRGGHLVLVYRRPIRAATAVGSALSLFVPYVAMAGGIPLGSSPSYYWEIADPLGTGMVMLDEEGARVRHQTFSPFGRVHAEVGGSGLRTFYAGHRRDEGSGMFYMQARWYDPGAGTMLSVDPLVPVLDDPLSSNPYSYSRNNPINSVDPQGTDVWRVVWTHNVTGERVEGPWQQGSPTNSSFGQKVASFVDARGGGVSVNGGALQSVASVFSAAGTPGKSESDSESAGNVSLSPSEAGDSGLSMNTNTVWGEEGVFSPGNGEFSGEPFITAVGQVPRGLNETVFGSNPVTGIMDGFGDLFISQMMAFGGAAMLGFGFATNFIIHLGAFPFERGRASFRSTNRTILDMTRETFDASGTFFESGRNTLIRTNVPQGIREDVFSSP